MKPTPEETDILAAKIAEIEERLQSLEEEIEEIGEPAAHELMRRLEALKIEETALKRNLVEVLDMENPGERRMEKIEKLLEYIRREEKAVEREAVFLQESPPSSMELAAETGSKLLDFARRAIKRVVGSHHPLGESVFVNHSPQSLEKRSGKQEDKSERTTEKSDGGG